jgi:hypothetical protein
LGWQEGERKKRMDRVKERGMNGRKVEREGDRDKEGREKYSILFNLQ